MTVIYKNQTILVLGYAKTGKSVVSFLLEQGANVILNDYQSIPEDEVIEQLKQAGGKIITGEHPLALLEEPITMIVKNPGIKYQLPFLQVARDKQIPIITDIELFYQMTTTPIIAVTGSNGKTTTTSLIHAIIEQSEKSSILVGNIGIPALSQLEQSNDVDYSVMELSSFQLMGVETFHPHISVITNITSAHIDYHGSRENYIQAKLKLIQQQTEQDFLVYNADDEQLYTLIKDFPVKKVPFAVKQVTHSVQQLGAYVNEGWIYFKEERLFEVSDIQIPGEHNIENVLAAVAAAKLAGIPNNAIHQAVKLYHGEMYRIQKIAEKNGVTYYNDSKATNTQATITALKSFNQSVVYIGGGLDRGDNFDVLCDYVTPVRAAIVYGETAQRMAETFRKAGILDIYQVTTLEQACHQLMDITKAGDTVLFSPCCASWDQFNNFEERGALFTQLIHAQLEI